MPIETFILFLFTAAIVVFAPSTKAIAVASQGATNGGRRALVWMFDRSDSLVLELERK